MTQWIEKRVEQIQNGVNLFLPYFREQMTIRTNKATFDCTVNIAFHDIWQSMNQTMWRVYAKIAILLVGENLYYQRLEVYDHLSLGNEITFENPENSPPIRQLAFNHCNTNYVMEGDYPPACLTIVATFWAKSSVSLRVAASA